MVCISYRVLYSLY